jgi:SRSO17 transposase
VHCIVALNLKALTEIMKLQQAYECYRVRERNLEFKRELEAASQPYLEIQKNFSIS